MNIVIVQSCRCCDLAGISWHPPPPHPKACSSVQQHWANQPWEWESGGGGVFLPFPKILALQPEGGNCWCGPLQICPCLSDLHR